MRFSVALILSLVILAGCTKEIVRVRPPPKVVEVTVEKFAALPKELTADCYDEQPKEQTYTEAKRLANLRTESIAECNARWAKVRKLQGQSKP